MRTLIIDTYYAQFLADFYNRVPDTAALPYEEQRAQLMRECFGTADFYSAGLGELGHEAHEVVATAHPLQAAWARQHDPMTWRARWMSHIPRLRERWEEAVLRAQIQWYRPDVLLVQNIDHLPERFIRWSKEEVPLVVAQHATVLKEVAAVKEYDLVISAVPRIVNRLQEGGAKAEHLKLGFGVQVLDRLPESEETFDVVHVGSYGPLHQERNELLERLASIFECHYWGPAPAELAAGSTIRDALRGEAWGVEMYRRRASSKVTVTKHIRAAVGSDVANCTMFETTGVGACLVVDRGQNLHEIFDPDKDVVAYDNHEDAVEKISYLLNHDRERQDIARAGQARTLREHTYAHRMREFDEIIKRAIKRPART